MKYHLAILFFLEICALSKGNFEFPKSFADLDDRLTFYWEFLSNGSVLMAIELKNTDVGYVGVGFGELGMFNVDMAIIETAGGNVSIHDYYSVDFSKPRLDTSLGGTDDVVLLDSILQQDYLAVKFLRAADTNDSYDRKLTPTKNYNFSWAYSEKSRLSYHLFGRGNARFDFLNGIQSDAQNLEGSLVALRNLHGYTMLVFWSFLIDISLWIVKFAKTSPNYSFIHGVIAGFISITTIILELIILVGSKTFLLFFISLILTLAWSHGKLINIEINGKNILRSKFIYYHFLVGLPVFVLLLFQVALGFVAFRKQTKKTNFSHYYHIRLVHQIIGTIVYLLCKVQNLIGIYIFLRQHYQMFLTINLISILALFTGDMVNRIKSGKGVAPSKAISLLKRTSSQEYLISLLESKRPTSEIVAKIPEMRWVLYRNSVYDLTNRFVHPGGDILIDKAKSRDITRYLEGAYFLEELEGLGKPHRHSEQAFRKLENFKIGTLPPSSPILVLNQNEEKKDFQEIKEMDDYLLIETVPDTSKLEWKLIGKSKLSPNLTRFYFTSETISILTDIHDPSLYIGSYFLVSHPNIHKKRTYTPVLSFLDANVIRRKVLLDTLDGKVTDENQHFPKRAKALSLFIKEYPTSRGFSKFIHDCSEDFKGFKIEGPFSTGIQLTASFQGTVIFFAAGTGLLPFVDFLDHLFKVYVSEAIPSLSNSELVNTGDVKKVRIKVIMFVSLHSIKDFLGWDFIKSMMKHSSKRSQSFFNLFLRVSDKENLINSEGLEGLHLIEDKFNLRFIEENVDSNAERFYICGPPGFMKDVSAGLRELSIPQEKLYML